MQTAGKNLQIRGERMICSNCGKDMPDDVNFCPSCGKEIAKSIQSDLEKSAMEVPEGKFALVKCRYDEPVMMEPILSNGKYTDDDRSIIKAGIAMMVIGFAGMIIWFGFYLEKSGIVGAFQEKEKAVAAYQKETEMTTVSFPQYEQYYLEENKKENDPYEKVYHKAADEVKKRLEGPSLGNCNFISEDYSEEYIVKKEAKYRDFGDGKGELLFEHVVFRVPATWDTIMNGRVSRDWFVNVYYYCANKDSSNDRSVGHSDFVNILNVERKVYTSEEDIINSFE